MVLHFESEHFVNPSNQLKLDSKSLIAFKEYLYGKLNLDYLKTDRDVDTLKNLYCFATDTANENLKAVSLKAMDDYAKKPTVAKNLKIFRELKQRFPNDTAINMSTIHAMKNFAKGSGTSCKAINESNHNRQDFFLGLQSLPIIKTESDFTTLIFWFKGR